MHFTQFPDSLSLADLNGVIGFTLPGIAQNDQSGTSVVIPGDINGDGIADLIIGAPEGYGYNGPGHAYVVFGKVGIGSLGSLSLSSLNGINGFVIRANTSNYCSLGGWIADPISSAGDINGDGLADFAIGGGCIYPDNVAMSYIVFGARGIGSSGTLDLSSLNDTQGFVATCASNYITLADGGDINGDGLTDLIFGNTYTPDGSGVIYVLFGQKQFRMAGSLNLASLSTSQGFNITGFPASSYAGTSVGGSDINGDGFSDVLIGSVGGTCCVVFGHQNIILPSGLMATSLNGTNGFIITNIQTTAVVGNAGDVNGDGIDDLIIGAPYSLDTALGYVGSSYVLFGKTNIGGSGTFDLSIINGINGFFIAGIVVGNTNGFAIGSAGDVNGDGLADLMIGSPTGTGASLSSTYVLFGEVGIGGSGTFDLSTLNGINGFVITGVIVNDGSGTILSSGDINGDGITDLVIGAPSTGMGIYSNVGMSYVVFGDGLMDLQTNYLTITKGHVVVLNSNNLNATSIKLPTHNSAIVYSMSNIRHGQFEQVSNPGLAITTFLQTQVQQNKIQFVHDDSLVAPSYDVSINDGGIAFLMPQPASVNFIHLGPRLITNSIVINQGQTRILTSTQLSAIDLDNIADNPSLTFLVSAMQHGRFEFIYNPGVATSSFSQALLQSANLKFVHDGSIHPPSYNISVSDGGIVTRPQACTVSFDLPPVLINNTLSINQGQAVILSSINLSAMDPDNSPDSLIFSVSNVQYGHFVIVSGASSTVSSFTQLQVQQGDIEFISYGGINPPIYSVAVSDGRMTTLPQPSAVTFLLAPVLQNNLLNIKQGETLILTSNNLSATDPNGNSSSLLFIITQVQHGRFELVNHPGIEITQFTQAQVQSENIQFVQDNSPNLPSYSVAVSNGKITTVAQISSITFDTIPTLINNQLTIAQGQMLFITPSDLSASDQQISAGDLIFASSAPIHGHFEDSAHPGVAITQFVQQRIFSGAIKFIADGSIYAPSYNITVSDGGLSSPASPAVINFILNSAVNAASSNTTRNAIIGSAVSGGVALLFLLLKLCLTAKANQSLKKALEGGESDFEKQQAAYYKEVIQPIANKVFERIDTSGFLGYRSERMTKAYLEAIEMIVYKIKRKGVNLNFQAMLLQERSRLTHIIARQVHKQIVKKHSFCSTVLMTFFMVEATPKQIENKAEPIALEVHKSVKNGIKIYSEEVIERFANKIFASFQKAGICDCCWVKRAPFIDAIQSLMQAMSDLKINLQLSSYKIDEQQQLLNETARQTSRILKSNRRCCTKLTSFFKLTGEFTADQLEDKVGEIATAVKSKLPTKFFNDLDSHELLRYREQTTDYTQLLSPSSAIEIQTLGLDEKKNKVDGHSEGINKLEQELDSRLKKFENLVRCH